ncbi:MAG: DUF1643 domain-containing protein [Vicinamibacterales bacterium]
MDRERGAVISADGRYRYKLWRRWDDSARTMLWVLLNPSTADANSDDPTLRRCVGFAKQHGYSGIVIVNLFAYRATDPRELRHADDPVGPDNDAHIATACGQPGVDVVVAGWGAHALARPRAAHVRNVVDAHRGTMRCFAKSKDGHPRHPLYVPYSAQLMDL